VRSFYTDEAVIVRPQFIDDNGTQVPDYTVEPAEEIATVGRHQYLSSDADFQNRITPETTSRWLGAIDLDVRITDRLLFAGKTFEPTGPSIPHRSPSGLASSSLTPLKES